MDAEPDPLVDDIIEVLRRYRDGASFPKTEATYEECRDDAVDIAAILQGPHDGGGSVWAATFFDLARGEHDHPPADWWTSTMLGRVCAAWAGELSSEAAQVLPTVAAAMLGVSRPRVHQLVAAGQLERHPDGGVLRASILELIQHRRELELVQERRPSARRRNTD